MTETSSSVPPRQAEAEVPRRPAEVDKYVDEILTMVCDTSRRYILELLALPDDDGDAELPERRSGDIARAIGLSPATTSEHLRHLQRAGLVTSRREGNVVNYRLRNRMLVRAFQDFLRALDSDYASHHESG